MSIYQYKDSSRAELWRIVQIQAAETEVMLKSISNIEERYEALSKANQWFIKRISELEKEAKITLDN
jgi:hypothetical protein